MPADAHDHAHHTHGPDCDHDHPRTHVSVSGLSAHGTEDLCCSHNAYKDAQAAERWMLVYLVGGMLLVGAFVSRRIFGVEEQVAAIPALIAALLLGLRLFVASFSELMAGRASSSSLAALAIIASISQQHFETAGWLALILVLADQILRRTAISAQTVIEQLVRLTPNIARVVRDGAEREVALGEVKIGETVRVRPGENLPVDGVVTTGRSTIDQASLTGEAAPHEVQPGESVYAGTTNLSGSLDVRVTQVGGETTIGKVSKLIAEAEQTKTPKQLLIEQVSRFYVPVVLSISFLVWFLTSSTDPSNALDRAITVLVVTCPAALLLSSPTAMVAAFAAAARLGVLIKNASQLEAAADIDTAVFDKTGTMTTGKFAVARLAPANGVEGAELLSAAANGEQHSNHPLARSILQTASAARITPDGTNDYQEIHGRGVQARTSMGQLMVGRASWIAEVLPHAQGEIQHVQSRIEGMTGVHVARDGRYLGAVGLEDKVRAATKGVVEKLRELGVKRVAIFTGDRLSVAERVGRAVGADNVEAECLPEEKHALIRALNKQNRRTLMVGDGINDGPSLAEADVGIAMGLGGSDIAANSAGVALMNDDLSRVPFLIELSRRNRAIIAQNIAISVVVALVGLALAASGKLEILTALVFHFLGDILVIANSFRLFRFGEQYAAEPAPEDVGAAQVGKRAGSASLTGVPAAQTAGV